MNILKGCTRGNSTVGVSFLGVINIVTHHAYPSHCSHLPPLGQIYHLSLTSSSKYLPHHTRSATLTVTGGVDMRIIALQGSPRRDGHTAALLESFLSPLRATHTVKRIDVCYQHILPCQSCYACQSSSACVTDDDMQDLYSHLAYDDVVVLASPVYFYGVTAQLKAVIDRCQPFWANPSQRKTTRVGVLLLTAGAPDAHGTGVSTTESAVRIFMACIGAPLSYVLSATNTDAVPVCKQHAVLEAAAATAKKLAHATKGGEICV